MLSGMALVFVFLLGVANFALHKAVLESGHPLIASLPGWLVGRASMAVEFVFLLVSLMLVARGHAGWAWGYAGYACANAASAWLVLTRRM